MSTHRPPGPRGIFRNSRLFYLRRHPEKFLRLAREYGDVVYFRIGTREVFLVSDPAMGEQILRGHYAHFTKDWGPVRGSSAFKNGLLTSEGGEHRAQRQKMSAIFARGEIESRRDVVAEKIDAWSARQRDGARIDLFEEMETLATAISTRLLFGCEIDPARVHEVTDPLRVAFRRAMFPYADRLRRRHDRGVKMQALVDELRRRAQTVDDGLLVPIMRGQSDPAIANDDQLATFLVAGQETVRVVTSYAWFLLSANPAARETLIAEAQQSQPGQSRSFAEAVLMESMRLYPPQWMIGRRAAAEYPLNGYTVPKDALVLVSPYIIQRDPRWFDQPDRFLPERWLRSEQPPRAAYFPFGAGPRRCIGEAFALIVATMMLARIAREWTFDCDPAGGAFDARATLQPVSMPAVIRAVSAPAREPAALRTAR